MENKFVLAKNYNIQQDYQIQTFIDCKDTVNHWCVGEVVDRDEEKNLLRIHFEGWSQRYDEWIKKNSQRLAPFRRHTEGYTGQKKNAFREFKMNFPHHKFMAQRVQDIIKNDFKAFDTPSQLTQFIRGNLYFYVDSLISFLNTTADDLPAIFEFMKDVFLLIFKWLEIFPSYLTSFQDSFHHPQLYLVSYEAAISLCGNELFSILEKCFGRCIRCNRFFQKFSSEYMQTEGDNTFAAKDKCRTNGLMASLLNMFGNLKGFEKVINFISFDIKDSKDKLVKGCPFILVMKLLRSLSSMFEIADRNFSIKFAEEICSALVFRLDNLQESEIKELDKDILRGVIEVLKEYMMLIQPQQADQIAELRELQVAEKYLRCPFFEKRVRGINELKEIYFKVANASSKTRGSDQYPSTKWLTFEQYARWLIEEKIIEFIFIENPHVELIKRSGEIMKLLASDERFFSPEIVEMLWVCCVEKHEDIVRATLDLIQDLAIILPLERLAQLSAKLKGLKENEFDEKLVAFLKNYTLNTMKNIIRLRKGDTKGGMLGGIMGKKKEVKIDESKYIDLSLFWNIFQDSNKVSQKVKDLALNSLIEILQELGDNSLKEQFTAMAIENLKKGDTFYSSIIFLKKVLNTYPLDSQIKYKTAGAVVTVQMVLADLFKKTELFDLLLSNLGEYLKQASISKQKLTTMEKPLQQLQLVGFTSHEDFISVVLGFFEYILINSKVTLSFEHVERLFQLLVTQAVSEYESNALFELITKENETAKSKERRFLLDDNVRNQVFQKIFCNSKYLNFEKINLHGFSCFKRLFLIINEEEKSLEISRDRVLVNNLNQLQGIDTLWAIGIQCENQDVKEVCRDFLVDLYLRIKVKSTTQKKSINELFPQKCFTHFRQCVDRPEYQLNCLRLIKTFIARFDGEHIQEEDMSQFPVNELKIIGVTLNPDKAQTQVKAHPSQKLWQIKKKMATHFKMRLSEFYIKTKQGPLDERVYDEQLKEYKIETLVINRVPQEEMEKEFPRYLIGFNSEYLNSFLELLKSGKEECKREILSLLEVLPINLDVKLYVRDYIVNKIQPSGERQQLEWQKLFQWNKQELATCTYYLMTLEELAIPRRDSPNQEVNQIEQQTKNEFTVKLLQNGGFQFLFELFSYIDKKRLERDIIRTKALSILLRLISHIFSLRQTSAFKNAVLPNQIGQLIEETLSIVDNYVQGVHYQQHNPISVSDARDIRLLKKEWYILLNSFSFMNRGFQFNHQLIERLYTFPQISSIFRIALIDIESDDIQIIGSNMIKDITVKLDSDDQLTQKPAFFFMKLFLNECLEYALKVQRLERTRIFFDLVTDVFTRTEVYKSLHEIRPVDRLAKELTDLIYTREIKEISARDEDVPLQGLFSLLRNLFQKFPAVREQFEQKNKLLAYLIHDCLFHKETRGQLIQRVRAMPPKCKNNSTREKCLDLLNELCINNQEGIYSLIRYLKGHISETFWRTPRKTDWSITVHQQERSLTGFVGLKNIGCICYMNSILQQLFMIPTFRKAILEVEDANFGKEPTDENVLHQLKMIFGSLMEIEKQYFNPKKFCSAFKDIDGSPIDPMVQKDVDEFFNMAMDRVENLVKGKKEDKVIKNLFQGVLANEFICKGCPHYSEREEPFMTVSLQVKNKHSIKESLEAFVEGEMLEGDNAYYCEKCEKKVNTLKRCCIKRMPNVLFMVLKRFEFNFDTMTKFKINDYCEFPMHINMREFSQEHLARQDLLREMEDKNLTQEDLSEEQRAILERDIPSRYYDYNLRGTVIHIGTAEQGHYISYIQDRENTPNRWYEFNDHLVKEFNPDDIPYEAFGGEDESFLSHLQQTGAQYNEQLMKQLKTKIKNAYILIYERDDAIDMERFNEFMDDPNINTNKQDILFRFEQCKLSRTTSAQIQIPPPIHDFILEKNKKFWLSKFIFNRTYIESVLNIFKGIEIIEDLDYAASRERDQQAKAGTQLEIFKFLTTFFLTTVIRAKERKIVPSFMQIIREALKKNIGLSIWLLESFVNQDLIKEFLLDCPIPDMKRFVAGLFKTAMQTVYKYEEENLKDYCSAMDSGILDYALQSQSQFVKQHRVVDMKQQTTRGDTINSGLCQNLNVITLTHHNEKLPILVLMINSFIHFNVSLSFMKNIRLSGQFYQVFGYFADLGPIARLYLLKCKTVGRLLDLFFNDTQTKNPQVSDKFRNTSLEQIPLFDIDKSFYIPSKLEKNDIKISLSEKKSVQQEATSTVMFLLYTVSKLSRSCCFVKDSTPSHLSNDTLNYVLDSDEIALIINHDNDLIWRCCDNKLTRNSISDMFAHISYENKEFSLQFLPTVLKGLLNSTFDKMKNFERPLIRQIMIKDRFQVERTQKTLQGLFDIMKQFTTFYKEMDSIIDIVYKITQRSQVAIEFLNKNPNFLRFIEQWCKENPHIPLNQQKTRIFKQGIVSWSNFKPGVINQQTIDKISQYQKDRLQKITSLVTKETQPNENTYDSDDDMYQHEFQVRERIDFVDLQGQCFTGTIEVALDEMVKCVADVNQVNQKPIVQWIGTETDWLSAPLTITQSEKRKFHMFYMGLLRAIRTDEQ